MFHPCFEGRTIFFRPHWEFLSTLAYPAFALCVCAHLHCGLMGFGQEGYLLVLELLPDTKLSYSWMCFRSWVKQEGNEPKGLVPSPNMFVSQWGAETEVLNLFSFPGKSSQARCALPHLPPLPNNLFSLLLPHRPQWCWLAMTVCNWTQNIFPPLWLVKLYSTCSWITLKKMQLRSPGYKFLLRCWVACTWVFLYGDTNASSINWVLPLFSLSYFLTPLLFHDFDTAIFIFFRLTMACEPNSCCQQVP